MIKVKRLLTNYKHYKKFLLENNHSDRLSKWLKILPDSSKDNLLKNYLNIDVIQEEILNKPIPNTYKLEVKNSIKKKVLFYSNSNNLYSLDVFTLQENIGIYNHISFTIGDSDNVKDIDYENLTDKNEMLDLMGRIQFILQDLINKNIITNNFCIGGTDLEKKNKIYYYLLKVIVGEDGFKKVNTTIYPKTGWGLYFSN